MFAWTARALVLRVPGASATVAGRRQPHAVSDVCARNFRFDQIVVVVYYTHLAAIDNSPCALQARMHFFDESQVEWMFAMKVGIAREVVTYQSARAQHCKGLSQV